MIHDLDYIIAPELSGERIRDVSAAYIPFWLIGEVGRDAIKTSQAILVSLKKYKRRMSWGVMVLCLAGCAHSSDGQVEFEKCRDKGGVYSVNYSGRTGAYQVKCEMVKFKW